MSSYEYLSRVVVEATLEVDNPGQCVIRGRNDLGEEFYLVIRTELGFTEQFTYGPVTPEIDILPFSVALDYKRYEYSEYKIDKAIDKFLNDPKHGITQADEITIQEIIPSILQSVNKIIQMSNAQELDRTSEENS